MATVAASPTYAGAHTGEPTGLWSWLTTVDHKRIGVLYLYTSLFFFLFGGLEAVIIRAQLMKSTDDTISMEVGGARLTLTTNTNGGPSPPSNAALNSDLATAISGAIAQTQPQVSIPLSLQVSGSTS